MTKLKIIPMLAFCIFMAVVLVCYLEKFLFGFLKFFLVSGFLTFILILALHVILIRIVIRQVIFPGSSFLLKKFTNFNIHRTYAQEISIMFKELEMNLILYKSTSQKPLFISDYTSTLANLKIISEICRRYTELVDHGMKDQKSQYVLCLYNNLKVILDCIAKGNLIFEFTTYISEFKEGRKYDFRSLVLDEYLDTIVDHTEDSLTIIEAFLFRNLGMRNKIKTFLHNDIFGNELLLASEMKLKYKCEEITIGTSGFNTLSA